MACSNHFTSPPVRPILCSIHTVIIITPTTLPLVLYLPLYSHGHTDQSPYTQLPPAHTTPPTKPGTTALHYLRVFRFALFMIPPSSLCTYYSRTRDNSPPRLFLIFWMDGRLHLHTLIRNGASVQYSSHTHCVYPIVILLSCVAQ